MSGDKDLINDLDTLFERLSELEADNERIKAGTIASDNNTGKRLTELEKTEEVIFTSLAKNITQITKNQNKIKEPEKKVKSFDDREFKWIGKKFDEVTQLIIPEAIAELKERFDKEIEVTRNLQKNYRGVVKSVWKKEDKLEEVLRLFIKEVGNYLDTDRFEYLLEKLEVGSARLTDIEHHNCKGCKYEKQKSNSIPCWDCDCFDNFKPKETEKKERPPLGILANMITEKEVSGGEKVRSAAHTEYECISCGRPMKKGELCPICKPPEPSCGACKHDGEPHGDWCFNIVGKCFNYEKFEPKDRLPGGTGKGGVWD